MGTNLTVIALRAFGVLIILLAGFRAFKGSFKSEDNIGMTEVLNRSSNPVRFWGQLAVQVAVGLALLFVPIQL
jgi:hypothetical protein